MPAQFTTTLMPPNVPTASLKRRSTSAARHIGLDGDGLSAGGLNLACYFTGRIASEVHYDREVIMCPPCRVVIKNRDIVLERMEKEPDHYGTSEAAGGKKSRWKRIFR